VQPTVEMAKRNSKQRIDPLIEESEVLRSLVSDPRSRDSGNTVLSK
jgi:phage terminase large subunit GpA-like protein